MLRHLVLVLGDQLDAESAAFDGFDPAQDAVLMMEVREEASHVPQNRRRLGFFFSAMRHFAAALRQRGWAVHYVSLDDPANAGAFAPEIRRHVGRLKPEGIRVLEPGDWRVRQALGEVRPAVQIVEDRHFLCSTADFAEFSRQHPRMVMETFYRAMRRRLGILLEADGNPAGGSWNFDAENRAGFGRQGPPPIPPLRRFKPDAITAEVLEMVAREFPDGPGRLEAFDLPVTRRHALAALRDFVEHRLPLFGQHQDAMWSDEAFLFHAVISGPLNLHLLNPREVVAAVLENPSNAPLNAVEGFVRQVIGWREFVRGVYWREMPDYAGRNTLGATLPMPRFYWTGETDMRCLSQAIRHTIDHAYAHHIERLMVLGLFALLLGVKPYDVHRWHMSMFWDAIDWVSLPNTLGMSQQGDGGVVGTKPYAASGNYINRMSDHCRHCRFDPKASIGEAACPFTTLYWDFLARHRERYAGNQRMRNQYSNLDRKDPGELGLIRVQAEGLKARLTAEAFLD
jgi:deoxyribodipyrimidine photolyase-related protein